MEQRFRLLPAAAGIIGCVASLAVTCGRAPALGPADFPCTAAGRCAAAYFNAFNSGDDDTLGAFVEKYRSPSYLELHPPDENIVHQNRLREIFGTLTPVRIALSLELQLTVLADPEQRADALVMRFQLESEAPHYLAFVTFSGIEKFDVPDEYVAYVATRAAPVDEPLRKNTVQSVAELLRSIYVYPELGRRMADTLLQNLTEGLYKDLRTAGMLAERLTEDAGAVSKDLHIWIEAQNPMAQASTDPANRDVESLRRDNYDFREVKMLDGDIGYLKFDMIHDDVEAKKIVVDAFSDIADCRALIFDLRDNIGGEWGTADMILGYLLPGGTIIGRIIDRDGRVVEERTVPREIPGTPFDENLPVYVLTSGRTGSAAEALAYALKNTGRAIVVGEVTCGAAHPSEEVVVNDYFRVSIPFRRSESAVTGTDWEGAGVIPQIKVPAADALGAASNHALKRIGERK